MPIVDNSALSSRMKERVKDYQKIFSLKSANGFKQAKKFLTTWKIDQKGTLKRNILGNVTQPGLTGSINNQSNFMQHKERPALLSPAKVDLYLGEIALEDLRNSFLNSIQSADVNDIYSIAGANYIMEMIMKQIGKEVNAAIWKGALGFVDTGVNETAWQGGLNLFDGFAVKMLKGYATSGSGWVGDIPGGNKVVSPASSVTKANILAELTKMRDIIFDTPELNEVATSGEEEDKSTVIIPPGHYKHMVTALDELTYKKDQLIELSSEPGVYQFKLMPNVKIKGASFMNQVDNMWWSPDNNRFWLSPIGADDITSILFEKSGRGIQILIDWKQNVDYADGRLNVLHK